MCATHSPGAPLGALAGRVLVRSCRAFARFGSASRPSRAAFRMRAVRRRRTRSERKWLAARRLAGRKGCQGTMARQSKTGSRRTAIVHLRLSAEENGALMAVCAARKLTVSEGLRRLVREVGGLGPTLEGEDAAAVEALTDQMNEIGGGLDQAVRAINVGRLSDGELLRDALTGLSQALREAHGLYARLCRKAQARHATAMSGQSAAAAPMATEAGA